MVYHAVYVISLAASVIWMIPLTGAANLTQPCTQNANCSSISHAFCKNNTTCDCVSTYYKHNNTVCLKIGLIGERCSSNEPCSKGDPKSICGTSKKCECDSTYYPNLKKCLPKIDTGKNCTHTMQCKDSNAECKTKCTCKASHFLNTTSLCQERIGPGGMSCTDNSSCVEYAFCHPVYKNCTCQIGYTARESKCSGMTHLSAEMAILLACILFSYFGIQKDTVLIKC